MSTFNDEWVQKAMADDTVVANDLLRLRHQQPYLRRLLTHWTVRHPRTPRTNVTTPLVSPTRSSSPAMDQSETAPEKNSSKIKIAMNKSETDVVKKIPNKRLHELGRDVKIKRNERDQLKKQLQMMKIVYEEEKAANEMFKKRKLELMLQRPTQTVKPSLGPPQLVEADHCVATNLASSETVTDKALEDTTLVSAATESDPLKQQEIDDKEPSNLPDLNNPPEEYFTDFVIN